MQEYAFVFVTMGDWSVTATMTRPERFVSDYEAYSTQGYNQIEAV